MTETIGEIRAAAERLMEAFSTGDEDGYFGCFHPDATFLFHGVEPIDSRDEYRALVRRWKDEHGFRVLSATSHDPDVRVFDDTAILIHGVTTVQMWDGEESTLHERESIVFQRQGEGRWLAIHEHLSADETP
jgi:uncharacterized protein (TIGR02246 family)